MAKDPAPGPGGLIIRKGEMIVPLHRVHINPTQERIMWALAARYGHGSLSTKELEDVCYGDRRDGGPLYSKQIVRKMIFELRELLRPINYEILLDNGYFLVPAHD